MLVCFPCGGGHRAWDFCYEDNDTVFVHIKSREVVLSQAKFADRQHKVIKVSNNFLIRIQICTIRVPTRTGEMRSEKSGNFEQTGKVRGEVSQHALQVVSQHALQQVSGGWYPSMPCSRSPGGGWHALQVFRPTPGGVSRPTLGRGLQAHTRGSPGPHLRGCIPACTEADPPPPDGYCCGLYTSYWNAFLLF